MTTSALPIPAPRLSFALVGCLLGIALVLLAIVDFRRGFLLPTSAYALKTPFFVFSLWQLLLLALGGLGLWQGLRHLKAQPNRQGQTGALLLGLFALLLLDVLAYRGVAAGRALEAGKLGTDWLKAFGVSDWYQPLALSVSYLFTVWHATFLSCLFAALGLLALPRYLQGLQAQTGWRASVAGALLALTQPFCACCAALTSPALMRNGRSQGFAMAVLLGAPLLNLSTLLLAAFLLPTPYAILRIVGGLSMTLGLSYLLARFVVGPQCLVPPTSSSTLLHKWMNPINSPNQVLDGADFLHAWLRLSGQVALWLIPGMVLGTLLTAVLWGLWPSDLSNEPMAVAFTAVLGSLLMVSTWSEIPFALQMLNQGLTGPAATALLALPAANLASLWLIGKSTGQWRTAVAMGLAVMVCAFVVGLCFI